MEIDQTNYIHNVARIEIDKVKGRYGPVVRLRIKGENDEQSTLSFTLWGKPLERKAPEIVIRELDESQPEDAIRELVNEEPDV